MEFYDYFNDEWYVAHLKDEEIEYECVVTCKVRRTDDQPAENKSANMSSSVGDGRDDLTPAQESF